MLYGWTHKVYNSLRISFVIQHNVFKILSNWAREMNQWLRACTVCVEDLSSLLGIHVGELTTAYKQLRESNALFWPLGPLPCMWLTHTVVPHITHTKRKILKKNKNFQLVWYCRCVSNSFLWVYEQFIHPHIP